MSTRASTPETNSPATLAKANVLADTTYEHEASFQGDKLREQDGSYGRRLIPQIMDRLAAKDPRWTVFSLTKMTDGSLRSFDVSAEVFTKAVDRLAWWIKSQVGISSSIKPVGYIGPRKNPLHCLRYIPTLYNKRLTFPDDLRHVLLTYAAVKAGYSVCGWETDCQA